MSDTHAQINFDAPAVLRKWPSIKNERISVPDGPYQIAEGSLNDCIRQFMAKPATQHHLYEIHTAAQGETIIPVLSAKHILEIAPLRFFYNLSGELSENSGPLAKL